VWHYCTEGRGEKKGDETRGKRVRRMTLSKMKREEGRQSHLECSKHETGKGRGARKRRGETVLYLIFKKELHGELGRKLQNTDRARRQRGKGRVRRVLWRAGSSSKAEGKDRNAGLHPRPVDEQDRECERGLNLSPKK